MKIEDMTSEGLGIGHAEGMAVFVKDTVIGDEITAKIVKEKKTYAYGRLDQLLVPSPDRVEPVCPAARRCGGCQIQAMEYQAQLRFKERKVTGNLARIGGFDPEFLEKIREPIMGMEHPFHYRNKAQFPVGTDREGNLVAGFLRGPHPHHHRPPRLRPGGCRRNRDILEDGAGPYAKTPDPGL